MGTPKNDLTGQQFNNWKLIEYIGRSKYKAKCLNCGRDKELNQYFLLKGQIPKCTCETGRSEKGLIDLTGQQFGEWKVLEYADDKKWKCQCSCGTVRIVPGGDLRNGKSTSCGHNSNRNIDDLTGKVFGEWLVIEKGPTGKNGETQWLCECKCSMHTRKLVNAYSLKSGASKSCGHDTTGFKDITGQQFGNWKVIKYLGDELWDCECQCEKHTRKTIDSYALRNGTTKSCGCLTNQLRAETNKIKYGDEFISRARSNRTKEQIESVKTRENLLKVIKDNFPDSKPTAQNLGDILGIARGTVKDTVRKFGLEDYISWGVQQTSGYEIALNKIFPGAVKNSRDILDGQELDLYFPDKKLGIEFNGNYWHGELKKDANYHQKKSALAIKKGIRLIHIFEYEWLDPVKRSKILAMIHRILGDTPNMMRVGARECEIKVIESSLASAFADNYHLQGSVNASINLGCFYNNEIVGIMTFSKPRFDRGFDYELIRLCWKNNVQVIGGSEKLFKFFADNYNPVDIVSYSDMGKFTGKVYERLGFKCESITVPNYVWIDTETNKYIPRYKTQKKMLVEAGLGTNEETEPDIMHRLGYLRVYDCGNFKFVWRKDPSIVKDNKNTKNKRPVW